MGIYKKGENWYIDYYVQGREKGKKLVRAKNWLSSYWPKEKFRLWQVVFWILEGMRR